MAQSRSILVSGGGIGGLTAALALSQRGYRVEVCEQSPVLDIVGAGIQLSPNALRILDSLGVADAVKRLASAPDGIIMRSAWTNRKLRTVPLGGQAIARYGLPYLCLHRAELQQVLYTACKNDPDISVTLDSRVSDATVHGNGVSALVMHGEKMRTRRARALVVADGVRSALRDQVAGSSKASPSGFEAWRAMIPADNLPNWVDLDFTHLVMGRNAHAVFYPVSGKRYLNVVICIKNDKRDHEAVQKADPQVLLKRLRWWSKDHRALFEKANTWSIWPILERKQTLFWNGGAIAFIGDASHAMPPFAAQGAAMAIEDAAVLADCIQTHGTSEEAMRELAEKRSARIAKVRKLARANGSIYHMGLPSAVVRDLGMLFLPPRKLLDRQSWVYDWRTD